MDGPDKALHHISVAGVYEILSLRQIGKPQFMAGPTGVLKGERSGSSDQSLVVTKKRSYQLESLC